jgi:hypothetical protein
VACALRLESKGEDRAASLDADKEMPDVFLLRQLRAFGSSVANFAR